MKQKISRDNQLDIEFPNSIIIRINPHKYGMTLLRVDMQVLSIIVIFNRVILNYN